MGNELLAKRPSPLSTMRIVLLLLNYTAGFMFVYPIVLSKLTLLLDTNARQIPVWLSGSVYIGMILISVYLAWPLLKESSASWKQFRPRMLKINVVLFFKLYVAMFVVGALISVISQSDTSANQLQVMSSVEMNPIFMGAVTLIYAPIVEEIVFRGCIFRSFRVNNSFLKAAIISGLAFGLIHVFDSILGGNTSDLWYAITYAMMGFFMAYSYELTGNIYGSMVLHLFNNLLAFIAIIIT